MRAYLYTEMLFKRAAVSTACFYSPGYIEGVFANGLCVCRIFIEPLRVMHTHTHTHNMYIYIYTYIYTHVYILVYMPFSMCEALEMDEIRKVFCMCHELRF